MTGNKPFLEFTGSIDYSGIDQALVNLKDSRDYLSLDLTTRKRIYAIVVECLENIAKHSCASSDKTGNQPYISVIKEENKFIVRTGNLICNDDIEQMKKKIDAINNMDYASLTNMYEEIINNGPRNSFNGSGLGFIIIKLKSGNPISYKIRKIDQDFSFFDILIKVNRHIMRKLILEKTTNSPRVVLDPDNSRFEISGESRPPDVGTFYGEILDWMEDYSAQILNKEDIIEPAHFGFDLEYFNSSSAKYILDFCKQISSLHSKGKKVGVSWFYEKDDVDMLEAGKEMAKIARMPFEFVEKER